MMSILHVLVQPLHLIGAVLAFDIFGVRFDMPPNFPDESVSGSLQNHADAKE